MESRKVNLLRETAGLLPAWRGLFEICGDKSRMIPLSVVFLET